MVALLLAHAVAALLAPSLVGRLGRRAFLLLAAPPVAAVVWALAQLPVVGSGGTVTETFAWVPSLHLTLAFRLDILGLLMTVIVGGIGALVLAYCSGYFSDDEVGLGLFAASLTAFAGAMLGLVTTDDLLVLYVFWELTTVLSYLLIGHRTTSRASRSAATEALVVTTFGGLAMLGGIILLGQQLGTYRISELIDIAMADPGVTTAPVVIAAVLMLLVGAVSKSALVPFHFWLPGAMAAPTPVSAYLHAAAMVKAGVYLVARFAPGYAVTPGWRPMLLGLGLTTMLLGGYRALRQYDLKLLLAYGTVSQLGFLLVLVGTGSQDAALAGLTMLAAHALFKASLFLVVGAIDHATGTRDLRKLSGLRTSMPWLFWTTVLALASMAGLPPLLGFVGKEAAYTAYWTGRPADTVTLAVLVLGSGLTVAYSARFLLGGFGSPPGVPATPVHRPTVILVGPPAFLAVLGLIAGPLSPLAEPYLQLYTGQWPASEHPAQLGVWHGFGPPLALSALSLAIGAGLFLVRARVEAAQARLPRLADADGVYRWTMRGLDRASLEVTGGLQRGSLPVTLGSVLVVVILLAGWALLGVPWPDSVRLWDNPGQVGVAVITVMAAVWAARARRMLRAALLVGVTGYGTAMLFLFHGAPDLALTQVLVETVSLVVFVLVLRRLPGRFSDSPPGLGRWVRAGIGTLFGAAMAAMVVAAAGAREAAPASVDFAQRAVEYGGGKNIVNVILVDIRAWDTMGELSVVLAAATGVASLVFLRDDAMDRTRRRMATGRRNRSRHVVGSPSSRFLADASGIAPQRRSTIFEVVTRLVFHTIVMYSLYLLFSGHNHPGGGFAAGLVVGLALTVRYLAGGREELRAAAPIVPGLLMGAGLFLSAGTGLVSTLVGGDVLQSWAFDLHLPLLGEVHLVTSLFFDLGVYLVVIGLMLDILRSLGAAIDLQIEAEPEPTDRGDVPVLAVSPGRVIDP